MVAIFTIAVFELKSPKSEVLLQLGTNRTRANNSPTIYLLIGSIIICLIVVLTLSIAYRFLIQSNVESKHKCSNPKVRTRLKGGKSSFGTFASFIMQPIQYMIKDYQTPPAPLKLDENIIRLLETDRQMKNLKEMKSNVIKSTLTKSIEN
ncbi:hypothetical protein BLOT_007828 [Blomia tropicalis]|nr:hypothetical protein BLOT_007828 [Blomia tropicalis]